MRAEEFVKLDTLLIMGLGLVAFIFDSIAGVMFAKFLNLFSKTKVNPMVGANVAGQIASVLAGGMILNLVPHLLE